MSNGHALDPRLKRSGFSSESEADVAVAELSDELHDDLRNEEDHQSELSAPAKKPKLEISKPFLSKILAYLANRADKVVSLLKTIEDELQNYFLTAIEDIDTDVYSWWHQRRASKLYKKAINYLIVPATSVPSERIFSTAGYVCNQRRAFLSGEHVGMILFLHENGF
jgi:hypothetical protein